MDSFPDRARSFPAPGHVHSEPGAGPVQPGKQTIALLRWSLMEAEHKIELWKEQADEARKENIEFKSKVRVLPVELDSTQKELAQVRDEYQGNVKLIRKIPTEIGESGLHRHESGPGYWTGADARGSTAIQRIRSASAKPRPLQ